MEIMPDIAHKKQYLPDCLWIIFLDVVNDYMFCFVWSARWIPYQNSWGIRFCDAYSLYYTLSCVVSCSDWTPWETLPNHPLTSISVSSSNINLFLKSIWHKIFYCRIIGLCLWGLLVIAQLISKKHVFCKMHYLRSWTRGREVKNCLMPGNEFAPMWHHWWDVASPAKQFAHADLHTNLHTTTK